MKEFGKNITARIENARKSLGLELVEFWLNQAMGDSGVSLTTAQIKNLIDGSESGVLIHNGKPCFIYIREHSDYTSDRKINPHNPYTLNRVHFSVCRTLDSMVSAGRIKRYQMTIWTNNLYLIDCRGRDGMEVKLLPCKNCLEKLNYQGYQELGFLSPTRVKSLQNEIVSDFDAKIAASYLREHDQGFKQLRNLVKNRKLRQYYEPTGYPKGWRYISEHYRRKANFTCESKGGTRGCGVNLREPQHQYLTDCHHINGDKNDCRHENLQCLCKECHAKEHGHYNPPEYVLEKIRKIRSEQMLHNRFLGKLLNR